MNVRRKFVPVTVRELRSFSDYRVYIKIGYRIYKLYDISRLTNQRYIIDYHTLDCNRQRKDRGSIRLHHNDIIYVDINNSIVPPRFLIKLYGDDVKFRYYDWDNRRWAIRLSDNFIFDSERGIRDIPSSNRAVLYKEPSHIGFDFEHKAQLQSDPASILTCGFELETQGSNGMDKGDFRYEDCGCECEDVDLDELENHFNKLYKSEVTTDESVSGFEFRTTGALSVSDFELALDSVYQYRHDIDTRCSFHIHIGLPDYRFKYDRAMRQQMVMYILRNRYRLPKSVQDRFQDTNASYFFLPDEGDAKMNFINFHCQGTLEFRCFGNVRTVEDAKLCLEIAVEALMDYVDNPTHRIVGGDWNDKIRDALESDTIDPILANYDRAIKISSQEIEEQVSTLRAAFNLYTPAI